MANVTCARCGLDNPGLAAPPLPTDLGARLYDSVCQSCWAEWLKEQTAIINHFGLNLLDPNAKQFLTEKTTEYFFGESAK